jgi:glycosyltransferase involved in cell wall biosynthesis
VTPHPAAHGSGPPSATPAQEGERSCAAGRLKVLEVDPELRFAGGETQVLGLCRALLAAGHDAELACDSSGGLFRRAREAGVPCDALAIRNAVDLRAAVRLRALLCRGCYDVVHFHTSRAHAMAPFVRGLAPAMVVTRRMDYRPNRLFAPWLYNGAVDAVAAISVRVAEALGEAGVKRSRITIIPSGVDCERFKPASAAERDAARRRLNLKPDEIALGTVGMLEERKGHRYLLEAVAAIASGGFGPAPDGLRCLIAGEGSRGEELRALSAWLGLGDRVVFLGLVEDPRTVLDALDIFVFPSLREGLGVALLEAMASGLAVVASRSGGVGEVVENGSTGSLVEPGDASALAAAIARLGANDAVRRKLGERGRARVCEGFSMDAMARRTIELYRACLDKRAKCGTGKGLHA